MVAALTRGVATNSAAAIARHSTQARLAGRAIAQTVTTPQVMNSRKLVETFDRLTSRSLLISSASSGLGETNSKA